MGDYCRIQCKENDDCPNRWLCGEGVCLDGDFLDRQKEAARKFAIASWDIAKVYRVVTGKKAEADPVEYTILQPEILLDAPNWKPVVAPPVIKPEEDLKSARAPFTQEQLLIGGGLLVGIVFLSLIISFLYAKASDRSSKNLF